MYHVIDSNQTRGIKKPYSEGGKKIRGCRGLLGRVIAIIELAHRGINIYLPGLSCRYRDFALKSNSKCFTHLAELMPRSKSKIDWKEI